MNRSAVRRLTGMICVGALWCPAGCGDGSGPSTDPGAGETSLSVYVVNYPLKYFAERVGGAAVIVRFPAPPGGDPAYWKPDAAAILDYQSADLILLNGAGYAKWIEHATLAKARLVDTSAAFTDRLIVVDDAVTHSHGPGGEHSHAGPASTTWLDLSLAVEHARAVKDALIGARPSAAKDFEAGFAALEKDLLELDAGFTAAVVRRPSAPILASHPVYQYLERRYRLNLKSLHWEPDEMPDEALWNDLKALLKTHPARWMIWEARPLTATVERLRAMGVGSVVVSALGTAPDQGDFLDLMRQNLKSLEEVYSASGPTRRPGG